MAEGFHFHIQRAFDVQRTASDPLTHPAWLRQILAGQQRFVDAGAALDDAPVGRDDRAGQHLHGVAAL